jgi:acyl-coenzyme A synthetase/AMP-(fatty) acid ligase
MANERDIHDCEPVESNHPLYLLYTSGIKELMLRER